MMPKRLSVPSTNELVDSWGRRNRKLPYYRCKECGKTFKPYRRLSVYCSRPCMWKNNGKNQKTKSEYWWENSRGYMHGRVWIGGKKIQVRQHRWFMEKHLGRPLMRNEDVHHINGNKKDNRLINLQVIDHGLHTIKTHKGRRKLKGTN